MATRNKKQTAVIVKAPTKYAIIDETGRVRGTSSSYISTIDIAKQLGFEGLTEEVTLEQCLHHIYSEDGSLHGLQSKLLDSAENKSQKTTEEQST